MKILFIFMACIVTPNSWLLQEKNTKRLTKSIVKIYIRIRIYAINKEETEELFDHFIEKKYSKLK